MSKPIPDKVLRVFANGPYAGDSRAWHDAADEIEKIDLARELLALREAARRVGGWGQASAPYNCKCGWFMPVCDGPSQMSAVWSEHAENCAIEAIRALLPEESR